MFSYGVPICMKYTCMSCNIIKRKKTGVHYLYFHIMHESFVILPPRMGMGGG